MPLNLQGAPFKPAFGLSGDFDFTIPYVVIPSAAGANATATEEPAFLAKKQPKSPLPKILSIWRNYTITLNSLQPWTI
jgi:hypothetical protein